VERADIEVDGPAELSSYLDCFGNRVHHFSRIAPHDTLVSRLTAEVETLLANPFDFAAPAPARQADWLAERLRSDPPLWDFVLHRSDAVPELPALLGGLSLPSWEAGRPLLDAVQAAMHWIADEFRYVSETTDVHAPLAHFLETREGVCQDFAHLLIAIVRSWRVPARYVVGYVDPGYTERQPSLQSEATHAWAEVLIPGAGWRGLDATHRLVANETYVAVAVGRDSRDAAPMRGSFKGDHEGEPPAVSLRVQRQPQ
jgi:transglutaminase-like putative cysteine protease